MRMKVEAPAKLNLHLHIGGRRPDGYHEIESLFIALALGDTLFFEAVNQPLMLEIRMDWQLPGGDFPAIPPEKNIITQAVSLFRSRTGYEQGLKITVEKRIPPGGGLGGGSSDAAAALLALNRLAAPDGAGLLSAAVLAEMGASLGSDVPFFMYSTAGSAAWVSGRGEKVQPFELPETARGLPVVLVNPGFPSDTAEAYRLLDGIREGKEKNCHKREEIYHETPCNSVIKNFELMPVGYDVRQVLAGSPREWPFFNDFLTVFTNSAAESSLVGGMNTTCQHIISSLKELGADFAGLSGSGSTCFGVFPGQEQAESARKNLLLYWPFVFGTFFLAH